MRKLLLLLSLMLLLSCSTDVDMPSSLSYPDWLEGTWSGSGITLEAANGDILITIDDYDEERSVLEELKAWEKKLSSLVIEKTSTTYSITAKTLVYDGDDEVTTSTAITITYSSETQVKLTLKGNWPIENSTTVSYSSKTLTKSE